MATKKLDFEQSMARLEEIVALLEKGEDKRLFYTSSEISSLRLMTRIGSMRYAQTKTALNPVREDVVIPRVLSTYIAKHPFAIPFYNLTQSLAIEHRTPAALIL